MDTSKIRYVTEPSEAAVRAEQLSREPVLGIDIETCPLEQYKHIKKAGLDPYLSRPRLLQAAALDGRVAVFDLQKIPIESIKALTSTKWAVFNGDFEYRHLTHAGLTIPRLHDVMLMDRLISHNLRKLDVVSADVLGINMDKQLQISDWSGELSSEQIKYAALDALATVRIADKLLLKIKEQRRLYDLWCGTIPVLSELSLRGQHFDWEAHTTLAQEWASEREQLIITLRDYLGNINLNSGTQLGLWLQDNLGTKSLKKWPRTPKNRLKTDADTFALFSDLPMIQPLLKYKAVSKLLSTYGQGYAKFNHPVTHRLHTNYRIGFTRSGRIAAQQPNNQNPPRLKAFRELFIPAPGKVFIGADYSQIELRVASLLSDDRVMLDAYINGEDLHLKTAAAAANVTPDKVTDEMRRAAKAINFGNLYGQGPAGLARTAELSYNAAMTTQEAKTALSAFNNTYPDLATWKRQQVGTAQLFRKVNTKLGLIRDFDIQGQGFLKGESQNIPVQGSAAEVLMSTLNKLPAALSGTDGQLYHNVHDELIIEVSPDYASQAATALKTAMIDGFLDIFPEGEALTHNLVDVVQGNNWAEVH